MAARLAKTLDLVVNTRVKWKYTRNKHRLAVQTKNKVANLGPTFVKIGQYVSTRGDIFPDEIIHEFTKLQDDVSPMDWIQVEDILERENLENLENISHKPLASASLGQVHTCTYNGNPSVVKVLRPNVTEQIEDDIKNLKFISNFFRIFNPTGANDLVIFVDELEQMLKMETDYNREAQNTRIFAKNFQDVDWVIVPEVYTSSHNAIVMEYVPSTKITEADEYNKKTLTYAITKAQIMQVLNSGFFHGDPHPGNVGVKDGKLVYYDFGMISEITIKQKNTLLALLIAITSENEDQILSILNNLGLIARDPTGLRKFVRFFLEYIRKNEIQDPEQIKELSAIQNNPVKLSGSFFYLIRSFALIEGISKTLDPEYSSGLALQKYAEESELMESAMVMSIRNTFTDMSSVSYRLSSIEKKVQKANDDRQIKDSYVIFSLIILLLVQLLQAQ